MPFLVAPGISGSGFRAEGPGFRVAGLGLKVPGLGFRALKISGLGPWGGPGPRKGGGGCCTSASHGRSGPNIDPKP